ncbi:MAG: carbon-nitrogen hydrolase family protein [Planctomycetota bacterium]|nr:carbon-nitrogen hydrolase family protein [Planctomycetota bacterium]MDA1212071.1 carbon-nitrogen hydrolase family protein [Planctomycetota bacterium]
MKIAGVQMDVRLGEKDHNVSRMIEFLKTTTAAGAGITIFPECAVSGYCFRSREEADKFAESIPGPSTDRIHQACRELDCHAIFGMLEVSDDKLYNAAVLIGPQGIIGTYRKVHLPFLGVDMMTTSGERGFEVLSAGDVRVGLNICYDAGFPEVARCLALQGADLIALPTNWPPGAECVADFVINTRALENGVYYAAVNRVGTERGVTFIAKSRICDPTGRTLAEATSHDEEVLYAEIDPERARRKHVIRVPGENEIDRIADRHPEHYGLLIQSHQLETPKQKAERG